MRVAVRTINRGPTRRPTTKLLPLQRVEGGREGGKELKPYMVCTEFMLPSRYLHSSLPPSLPPSFTGLSISTWVAPKSSFHSLPLSLSYEIIFVGREEDDLKTLLPKECGQLLQIPEGGMERRREGGREGER